MGLYEDLVFTAVYKPTLSGGTKPRTWNVGAQSFNGTSEFIIAPSGSTLVLGNVCWLSMWAVPSSVSGTRCILEFSGLTHGVTVWQIGTSYWASVHRSNSTIATVEATSAAAIGVAAHLYVSVAATGLTLYVNGVSAGSQSVVINTSNATDDGCVGAVYSDSRLPNGTAIDNGATTATNHFAGTLADPTVGVTSHAGDGALAMFNGPATVPVKVHHYNQLRRN